MRIFTTMKTKAVCLWFLTLTFWCMTQGAGLAEEFVCRGSDSTLEVVAALAKAFQEKSGVAVKVEGGGSSKGADACLAGEVPLAFMSRPPKAKETEAGMVGMPYAIDGVAIIVNPQNPAGDLTMDTLKAIYTGQMAQWGDGKPVMAFNRPETSGTREVFQEKVLGKTEFAASIAIKHDMAIHTTVAKAVTGIAFTSAGALSEKEQLKVLTVNGLAPTPENLRNGTYPIARTLHFATKGAPAGKVKDFLDFVKSDTGRQVITQVGFVTLK